MRTRKYIFDIMALAVMSTLMMVSCRKEAPVLHDPNNIPCKTYTQQFQAVWEGVDQSYVFWERDTVNWDKRYDLCLPIFHDFDARGTANPVTAEEYKAAWLKVFKGLVDHHFVGVLWNPNLKSAVIVNAGHQARYTTDIAQEISILKRMPGISDLTENTVQGSKAPQSWSCLLPGKVSGEKIAYFRFSGFGFNVKNQSRAELAPLYAFFDPDTLGNVGDRALINRDDVKGIIIDVRGNGGGSFGNIDTYIGSLLHKDLQIGYTRVKEGIGRLDYSAWLPLKIAAHKRPINKEKDVVLLVDANSISCSEVTAVFTKCMPNGKVVGDRTYGATGPLWSNTILHDVFYNGCFGDTNLYNRFLEDRGTYSNDNFAYYVYTSTFEFVDRNYESFEGKGVNPDILVPYNEQELKAGTDKQLERALEYLRNGK